MLWMRAQQRRCTRLAGTKANLVVACTPADRIQLDAVGDRIVCRDTLTGAHWRPRYRLTPPRVRRPPPGQRHPRSAHSRSIAAMRCRRHVSVRPCPDSVSDRRSEPCAPLLGEDKSAPAGTARPVSSSGSGVSLSTRTPRPASPAGQAVRRRRKTLCTIARRHPARAQPTRRVEGGAPPSFLVMDDREAANPLPQCSRAG